MFLLFAGLCDAGHASQVGFTEANMRALCDVGASTKSQLVGYIGQKGIGFKSVFRVTSAPEIHSRYFWPWLCVYAWQKFVSLIRHLKPVGTPYGPNYTLTGAELSWVLQYCCDFAVLLRFQCALVDCCSGLACNDVRRTYTNSMFCFNF